MAFKPRRKAHHMSKTTTPPSHRVYAVTKNGERSFWQPIGAAWVHSDGWGFNVKLDYLPPNGAEPDPSGPPSGGPFPRTMNHRIRSGRAATGHRTHAP